MKIDRCSAEGPIAKPRRRGISIRAGITVSILFAVASMLLVEALLFPWARSLVGGAVLVGVWHGEIELHDGQKQPFMLDLTGETDRCSYGCSRLTAILELCGARALHRYEGYGDVDNWRGTHFHLTLSPVKSQVSLARTIDFVGTWHGDTITVLAEVGPTQSMPGPAGAGLSESQASARSRVVSAVPIALRRDESHRLMECAKNSNERR